MIPTTTEFKFHTASCPACGHHIAVPFFDGGRQPLATLSWPTTAATARSLPALPLDFVMCVNCGHVFNTAFNYADVPYSEKPNLMFNRGVAWTEFLSDLRATILAQLPDRPIVVEIGHGDGSFLTAMAKERPGGRYIGFDPNGSAQSGGALEFRTELFDPATHLAELAPNMIISRHVLEHMLNPLGFLQAVAFAATCRHLDILAYFEVPCIDQAIAHRRTVDFYYEHSSQFTTGSFSRMLSLAGARVLEVGHAYGNEVVFGFAGLGAAQSALDLAHQAHAFQIATEDGLKIISAQLDRLHADAVRVAIWGGTGKSAAFMCRYGADAERFPVVVDSDRTKVGTFVPGTGQEIRFRDWLLDHPVDVIIVPPQWRAADIIAEMALAGIAARQVLIEHRGRLIDYVTDPHPYRLDGETPKPGMVARSLTGTNG